LAGNADKITLTETWDGKVTTIEFHVEGDLMILTLTYEKTVCKRIHKKV
jgi:hypothetical protein